MDADRFDTFAKRLVTPTTRRATLGTVAAGGLLSALGLVRSVPEASAAQRRSCVLALVATVRQGPSAGQMLTPSATQPGELRGELSFSLSDTGNLEDAAFTLPDGASFPVVGQATGHALQFRIEVGQRQALVAVGVGEREVATCQGAIDGLATGPQVGDLGDWHAAVLRQTEGSGGGNAPRTDAGRTDRADRGPAGATGATGATGGSGGACAAGLSRCRGVCVDLSADVNNCGACGTLCESGLVSTACRNGVCERANCPEDEEYCGAVDGCRDLSSDPNHCGACQRTCASEVCEEGVCGLEQVACPTGQSACNGVCVDLTSNDDHCGACGVVCGPVSAENPNVFTYCENSECVAPQCPAGTTDCSNYCADLMTSPVHCGVCGTACAAGETCVLGVCTPPPPPAVCAQQGQPCGAAGCCVGFCGQDETCECVSDGLQCAGTGTGGCCSGQPCNADGFCGICATLGSTCNSDAECCSGSYAALCCFDGVSLSTRCTDVTNIGFVCPGDAPGPVACPAGQTDCGGVCADLMAHAGHCGACGNSCGLGGVCNGGVCGAPAPTCLVNGSPCTYGVDVCCAGLTCYGSICQCSPPGDVCGDPGVCCSGVCNGEGFCN